ncbi:MAG: hypothetical protein IJL38_06700 [Bacteroidales bacterium]|nr:hypothetical protein [Bacteroidales bacterium]
MYKTQFTSQLQLADHISQALKPARFGYRITYEREPKMYKRANPYYGRVIEQQIITNPRLGCDWKAIETALQQRYNPSWQPSLSDPAQFQHHPCPFDYYNRYFETLHSDPSQFYLKANTYENTSVQYRHYLDGHLLLGDQLRDVLSFFRPTPPSLRPPSRLSRHTPRTPTPFPLLQTHKHKSHRPRQ